jgi:hypothetical protein
VCGSGSVGSCSEQLPAHVCTCVTYGFGRPGPALPESRVAVSRSPMRAYVLLIHGQRQPASCWSLQPSWMESLSQIERMLTNLTRDMERSAFGKTPSRVLSLTAPGPARRRRPPAVPGPVSGPALLLVPASNGCTWPQTDAVKRT